MTLKSLNRSHSSGSSMTPQEISVELAMPLRPRNGIHEIMRMMFEVQNGIVQSRKSAICQVRLRTWKARK